MKSFSISTVFNTAWSIFSKRPWFFIAACGLPIIASAFFGFISRYTGDSIALQSILNITNTVIALLLSIGMMRIALKSVRGETASWEDFKSPRTLILSYVGVQILTGLGVAFGFVLLIIPGIILAIAWAMAGYAIIDNPQLKSIEALKYSAKITKGHRWKLLLLYIVSGLVVTAGIILLGVGLLVATPIVLLAAATTYNTLHAQQTN